MERINLVLPAIFLASCAHSVYKQSVDHRIIPLSVAETRQFDASAKDSDIATYSDYFSFVGRDETGFVLFAIDCNRDRYRNKYFADIFVALHEQHSGFVKIEGGGKYPNPNGELISIPNSEHFNVEESEMGGFQINSIKNDLTLLLDPLTQVTSQGDGSSIYSMRVAAGILKWRGRVLKGRVIEEHLVSTTLSKHAGLGMFGILLRNSFGGGEGFQGLYLMTDDGRDVYLQNSDMSMKNTNLPKMIGFVGKMDGKFDISEDLILEIKDRKQGMGIFRRPILWHAKWGQNELKCRETSYRSFSNWIFGGFGMGTVEGEIVIDGVKHKVYGWSEIII